METCQPITESDPQLRNIKTLLRLRMNGEVSTAMRKSGLDYKVNFGLDATSIRDVAAKFQPDVILADKLWAENARECKILATLLHPKEKFTAEKANLWLDQCFLPELSEQLVFNLLQHLPYASTKVAEWIYQDAENRKTGGYMLALRLYLKKINLPNIQELLIQAKSDCQSENFQLHQTAERFFDRVSFDFPSL
ncbi:MAG TPA: DNA alkylation repair protein [Bacteroidales bacterium]|nr:DNA alkylation repair protein [Bacteroidales bacterium]